MKEVHLAPLACLSCSPAWGCPNPASAKAWLSCLWPWRGGEGVSGGGWNVPMPPLPVSLSCLHHITLPLLWSKSPNPVCSGCYCCQGDEGDRQSHQHVLHSEHGSLSSDVQRQHSGDSCAVPSKHGAQPACDYEQHCRETSLRDTCPGGGAAGDRGRRPGRRWRAESHTRWPTPSCAARGTHARCPGEIQSPAAFPPLRTPAPCTHPTPAVAYEVYYPLNE